MSRLYFRRPEPVLTFSRMHWHSHAGDSHADGIMGPLIIHSPNEPMQRGRDFDQEIVLFHTESVSPFGHLRVPELIDRRRAVGTTTPRTRS